MKILVTAGPTREFIDPVRFLSNRSSGKMGYAAASAANSRGHEVTLISGPTALPDPERVAVIHVTTAADMLQAVKKWFAWCDALIMAAAVADWRPTVVNDQKIKKSAADHLNVQLERTDDILASLIPKRTSQLVIGFAAETQNLKEEAARKLTDKMLDMIVANDVSAPDAGFEVDTNRAILMTANGASEELPLMTKDELGLRIVEWIERQG